MTGSDPTLRPEPLPEDADRALVLLRQRYDAAMGELSEDAIQLLRAWPEPESHKV